MLPFTTEDATAVLKKSANLNSALKNFLKREIKAGDLGARFVKDLKDLSASAQSKLMEEYISKSRPAFESHLLAIGKYAHTDGVNDIVGAIVDRYAEEFNATYDTKDDKIVVSNHAKFKSIVAEAMMLIDTMQQSSGFGGSTYYKNLVILSVFDKPVLEYLSANGLLGKA